MSVLRRTLLLLCVSVLLREGESNSPFDFFRDIKNRIFASDNSTDLEEPSEPSNSTGLLEEPAARCPGLDQDGVCTGVNGTQDGSAESLNQYELTNGTLSSDVDETTDDQLTWNKTVAEDTTITDNTQEWNITANNSTNDFEFSENEQNGTDNNNETLAENEEANNQTENTRSKRQINKLEVNSSLNTTETILKPQMINTTGFTGQAGNFSNNSVNNLANNTIDRNENISNATINNLNVSKNESITANVKSIDENQIFLPFGIPGNNTEEIIDNKDTYESSNITMDSSEDTAVESSNTISETNGGESILKNCTDCVAMKEDASFKNISLDLNNTVNLTEFKDQEKIGENTTQVNASSISGPTNITMLKDILENSTRIIEKLVQNIVPAISELKNEIKAFTNNNTMLENIETFNARITENQNNASEANNTQINNEEMISNGLLNSTTSQLNMTNNKYIYTTTNPFDETLNANNSDTIQSNALQLNLNYSIQLDSNTTGEDGIKREKRSLNFTFLSESEEEEEFPPSTFPDLTETPETELLSNVITNSTEWNSRNETNEVEVVGPVCARRYEQCTNSSDCCEDYECIGADENNTTLHCDLRPQNLSLSTYLPITDDDSVRLQ